MSSLIFWLGILSSWSLAQSTASDQMMVIGRLPCVQPEKAREPGIRQLVWELMKRTSMEAEMESRLVDPTSTDLFHTPFLLWSCAGAVAPLNDRAISNLQRFLTLGGFLFVDDPGTGTSDNFDRSIQEILKRLFPDQHLVDIPRDHVLYKSFFLMEQSAGRVLRNPLRGIEIHDRLAVVYSSNDLLGALGRDLYGNWEYLCEPGGEQQRENSFRLAINILFYTMCMDYKNDRVHLDFILRRRRL